MSDAFVLPPQAVPDDAPALIDPEAGLRWSYGDLRREIEKHRAVFAGSVKELVLLRARNDAPTIAAYLGALAAGHAVILAQEDTAPVAWHRLRDFYRPEWIFDASPERHGAALGVLHEDLSVLLSTSGSTGSPKLVRLSHGNLRANTQAIIEVLGIGPQDRVAAHLPLAYSYGLSVLHTHLAAGASLLLLRGGLMDPLFLRALREEGCTSFPGVPFHFEWLMRLGLQRLGLPQLAVMTQAGGRLQPPLVAACAAAMQERSGRFFVMYGQTEGAPRLTTLPAALAARKPGAVGRALPGGRLAIENGEVIYYGPNVMMGYAESRADLALGDVMQGRLATGDLGMLDAEGDLTLTGRIGRIAKIHGLRVDLDEIERDLAVHLPVTALEGEDALLLFTTERDAARQAAARRQLDAQMKLNPQAVRLIVIADFPLLANGKIDFAALKGLA